MLLPLIVIPANAGIQFALAVATKAESNINTKGWIPAFAGMTE
ncbi:MAG TPA: hypothetical protein VGQ93_10995 [Lysobacter sp.]|nr:hypothetical protein [Lysobacter sp.]